MNWKTILLCMLVMIIPFCSLTWVQGPPTTLAVVPTWSKLIVMGDYYISMVQVEPGISMNPRLTGEVEDVIKFNLPYPEWGGVIAGARLTTPILIGNQKLWVDPTNAYLSFPIEDTRSGMFARFGQTTTLTIPVRLLGNAMDLTVQGAIIHPDTTFDLTEAVQIKTSN